jgi:transposase
MGQHLIQAYALPTNVVRFDTTTFNVHHAQSEEGREGGGLLTFGHSKDHLPDLLQFKQGLGTLDPAGVPLPTAMLPGKRADDPLYIPAWRRMVDII